MKSWPEVITVMLIAFLAGVIVVPLKLPSWVFFAVLICSFLIIIVFAYKMAWRQGHSGIVMLPIRRGSFGTEGLGLKTNSFEKKIIMGCIALLLGLLVGFVIARMVLS
jgi:hypothetical protein